jgi:predicted ester cyclase
VLTAIFPTGKRIRWKFIHLRVSGGEVVKHFAVRDDLGLLRQLHGAGPTEAARLRPY